MATENPELAQGISGASFAFSLSCAISFPIGNKLCLVWNIRFHFSPSPLCRLWLMGPIWPQLFKNNPIHLAIAIGSGMSM